MMASLMAEVPRDLPLLLDSGKYSLLAERAVEEASPGSSLARAITSYGSWTIPASSALT